MRLFAAVRPPERVLHHLDLALRVVQDAQGHVPPPVGLRWTAPENRHLTAAFYGEVSDGAVDLLAESLRGALGGVRPFELRLRGAGVFAHRTLWVGVSGEVEGMHTVIDAAGRAGEPVGARADTRVRSRPHMTVGRIAPAAGRQRGRRRPAADAPDAAALVHALSLYDGPAWQVDEVMLLRSQPGAGRAGGPLYTALESIALAR
ncbi:RNA 2',3'-cyclic phosphodiesterase [Cellulomonas chengniuliangii]|uniref:RNA 2',3'-cyclic phosphodiesterase n=1 Tax=Cellulomonas chengniuliangii TaxID=2968084 RepID=A0ABY5KU69_9CELL|nr:RNA 2',3'-cyclic phosphodiesterase [Cellulomonas chengniuliangii]MCC2310191.1 RNA 2',3'-cyclic phosphodiesterase [Cellulomonas chengniuliangii]MCC2319116.1 RNA 2',3'-cyclic phosphodiesterase [Cellulomonas chengniuliangii]UUI74087.1 RNA 2',3'-cyclic phosphodiesterase [Cellulomonas chengniuliangii]